MATFYCATVAEFLKSPDEQVLAHLAIAYANRGYTTQFADQTLVWERDLRSLRSVLEACTEQSPSARDWGLLLEFSIPRKELRIDTILLVRDVIVILEAKSARPSLAAKRQLEEYALLLHYFHKGSEKRRIVPVLVSEELSDEDFTSLHQREFFPQMAVYWVASVRYSSWGALGKLLIAIEKHAAGQLIAAEWEASPYFPVPSILEAALSLRSGLSIRDIAHSEASEHEIGNVVQTIQGYIDVAREQGHHAICFVTGVPGSGKTLVGLSLAHSDKRSDSAIHFMSGNGPLVKVLQHLFTAQGRKAGASAVQSRTQAKTLIENVHVFARYYTEDNSGVPSNHAVIFDEAQRAWNKRQNMKKFGRDYSEPEMLLRIMERHEDWAIVIALVGGGQEINDGEAGIEEWGRALLSAKKNWKIYASPEVLSGGPSTAGRRLFEVDKGQSICTNQALHLRTSNRSLRAEHLATWVNFVLEGKAKEASSLKITERFPIFLTRDLTAARQMLRKQGVGANRYGLVGSSGATRLRAVGLEPSASFHADYSWEHWYLADDTDIRASNRCEVFATEFEIQGLELDWIGLCWGGDFLWDDLYGWNPCVLRYGRESKWYPIKNAEKRNYRRNAYRVLLTRARLGMVIFVPRGDISDATNLPESFDSTHSFLAQCGVGPLPNLP